MEPSVSLGHPQSSLFILRCPSPGPGSLCIMHLSVQRVHTGGLPQLIHVEAHWLSHLVLEVHSHVLIPACPVHVRRKKRIRVHDGIVEKLP